MCSASSLPSSPSLSLVFWFLQSGNHIDGQVRILGPSPHTQLPPHLAILGCSVLREVALSVQSESNVLPACLDASAAL